MELLSRVFRTILRALAIALLINISNEPARADQVIMQVQQQLTALGYDPGVADGIFGKRTENALSRFQEDHTLPPSGEIDSRTMEALGLATSPAQRSPRFGSVVVTGTSDIPREFLGKWEEFDSQIEGSITDPSEVIISDGKIIWRVDEQLRPEGPFTVSGVYTKQIAFPVTQIVGRHTVTGEETVAETTVRMWMARDVLFITTDPSVAPVLSSPGLVVQSPETTRSYKKTSTG